MDIFILVLVFIVIDALLLFLVFYFRKKKGLTEKERQFYRTQWHRILQESDQKHAVLDADKLLDRALQRKGFSGSLGEKLKFSSNMFSNINEVWFAHKLRNRLAHELNVALSVSDYKKAIAAFDRALRDLDVL